MYDDILVPTDGSAGVQRAIDHGIELASLTNATLHGLYVVDTADTPAIERAEWLTVQEALEAAGDEALEDVDRRAAGQDVDVLTDMRHGSPHEEVVAYADEADVDLIVMGTHGRSGLDRVLLGSVTENVIRHADTPVLVKRLEADDD